MKLSPQEKKQHPNAGLIPDLLWEQYFTQEFSDDVNNFMNISAVSLPTERSRYLSLTEDEKERCCIAYGIRYPEIEDACLIDLLTYFKLSALTILDVLVVLNRRELFNLRVTDFDKLPPGKKAGVILLAFQAGHLELFHYLHHLPETKKTPTLSGVNFNRLYRKAFVMAVTHGQLSILQRLSTITCR